VKVSFIDNEIFDIPASFTMLIRGSGNNQAKNNLLST